METCFGKILTANEMNTKQWGQIEKSRDWGNEFNSHKVLVLDERSIWFRGTFREFTSRCAKNNSMQIKPGNYGMQSIAILVKRATGSTFIAQIRRKIPNDGNATLANLSVGFDRAPTYWVGIRKNLIKLLPEDLIPRAFHGFR